MNTGDDNSINSKEVLIKTVDGEVLKGKLNLKFEERVSDLFTQGEDSFVILFDVSYKGGKNKTLFINKSNIIFVEPLD